MKKRIITLAGLMALSCALAVGCGNSTIQTETQSAAQTELIRLILIQTAVCSRSMKCMMEKEL